MKNTFKILLLLTSLLVCINIAHAQPGNGTIIQAEEEMCSYPHAQVLKAYPDSSSFGVNYSWIIAGKVMGTGPTYQLSSPIASNFDVTLLINSNSNIYYASKVIRVKQTPEPEIINGNMTICPEDAYDLEVREKYNEPAYNTTWFNEDGNILSQTKSIKVSSSGNYYTRLEKEGCISDTLSTSIKVLELNFDSLWAELPKMHEGDLNRLHAELSGDTDYFNYFWEDRSGNTEIPGIPSDYFTPPFTDDYRLVAYNSDLNCSFTSENIEIYVGSILNIPSAFTPNADNINDYWEIDGLNIYNGVELSVYNRWGDLLYNYKGDYTKQWDGSYKGKFLPIGVYFYAIKFPEGNKKPLTGTVTIIK